MCHGLLWFDWSYLLGENANIYSWDQEKINKTEGPSIIPTKKLFQHPRLKRTPQCQDKTQSQISLCKHFRYNQSLSAMQCCIFVTVHSHNKRPVFKKAYVIKFSWYLCTTLHNFFTPAYFFLAPRHLPEEKVFYKFISSSSAVSLHHNL